MLTVDEASHLDDEAFVEHAFLSLLERAPTPTERAECLAALQNGDAKTWLLGRLRYGPEGRARSVSIQGLRGKYLAQKAFRLPLIGSLFRWLGALASLPRALRYFRGFAQFVAAGRLKAERERASLREEIDALSGRTAQAGGELRDRIERLNCKLDHVIEQLELRMGSRIDSVGGEVDRRLEQHERDLSGRIDRITTSTDQSISRTEQTLSARIDRIGRETALRAEHYEKQVLDRFEQLDVEMSGRIAAQERDLARTVRVAGDAKLRLGTLAPPVLADTLEVIGGPLVDPARDRARVRSDVPMSELAAHERYAVFEAAFYDSALVAAKQRIYLPYIGHIANRERPFLDLGCGRGEFLRILAGAGVKAVGVDVNPAALNGAHAAGFEVAQQDILEFLHGERRMFSGASALQVVEHLTAEQIEELLALVARRLVPGALLIVETPNPLCPYALGQFHTDPTHVAPLPPERLRFAVEAAGFAGTRTLFQALAPGTQVAGPDPRAYYMDYAIIAYRSET